VLGLSVPDLELRTDAGKINIAVMVILAGVTQLPTIFGAIGAGVDRVLLIIFVLRKQVPAGFEPRPWIDEGSSYLEFCALFFLACVCVATLVILRR